MQAVVLLLLLGVSLCGVCGNEERSDPDTNSIIRAMLALQTQMKALQDQVQSQVQSLVQVQSQVQSLVQVQSQVQSLVQQQSSSRVAFHAGFYDSDGAGNYGPLNTDTTIKFKNVRTNIGNAYNRNTGLFTAPLRGTYVFHLTVDLGTNATYTSSAVRLKKNSDTFIRISDSVTDKDNRDSASSVAVVTLEQGDTVSAELQAKYTFHDYSGSYTTFSGFLLFPLSPSTK